MMQDLRQVLDWDPEFVAARGMLAMAQLEGGGSHAALDSMRATILLAPRNQTYLLNLAQIYMAGKSWDAAAALLGRLKNSPDPQVAKSAGEELEGLPMLKKYGTVAQDAGKSPSQQATSTPVTSASSVPPSPSSSSTAPPSIARRPPERSATTEKPSPPPAEESNGDHADQPSAPPQPDKRTIQFVKGKLVAVDCSQPPSAVLTVSSGAKVLKLRTEDYKSLTLIGADNFSCEWKSRTVAVNYRAGGKADGDLVSVELE